MKRSTKITLWVFAFFLVSLVNFAMMLRYGIGNNAGSKFYGDEFIGIAKRRGFGIGNNAGSEFYSNSYLRELRGRPHDGI